MHMGVLCLLLLCARALGIQSEELNPWQWSDQECLPIQRQAASPLLLFVIGQSAPSLQTILKQKSVGKGAKPQKCLGALKWHGVVIWACVSKTFPPLIVPCLFQKAPLAFKQHENCSFPLVITSWSWLHRENLVGASLPWSHWKRVIFPDTGMKSAWAKLGCTAQCWGLCIEIQYFELGALQPSHFPKWSYGYIPSRACHKALPPSLPLMHLFAIIQIRIKSECVVIVVLQIGSGLQLSVCVKLRCFSCMKNCPAIIALIYFT